METDNSLQQWLAELVVQVNGYSATVHLHENDGLRLAAWVNIPPRLQEIVAWVPNGKGMAGLALQRGEPVQTCNLQEDKSGNVKPGAKAVNAQGCQVRGRQALTEQGGSCGPQA